MTVLCRSHPKHHKWGEIGMGGGGGGGGVTLGVILQCSINDSLV